MGAAEDRETVGIGEEIFCATFSGYHDDGDAVPGAIISATLPEALAWANALADDVQLRLADSHHYFAAGRLNSANGPTWPPDDLEAATSTLRMVFASSPERRPIPGADGAPRPLPRRYLGWHRCRPPYRAPRIRAR